MKINEIVSPEDKLRLVQQIFNNTMSQLRGAASPQPQPQIQASVKPLTKPLPRKTPVKASTPKAKAPKIKKAPYAAPPKPLPKPAPLPTIAAKAHDQQQKNLAGHIAKAMKPKSNAPMPASLKPLPTSMLSPIDSIDKDKQKKFELAKQQADQLAHKTPNRSAIPLR